MGLEQAVAVIQAGRGARMARALDHHAQEIGAKPDSTGHRPLEIALAHVDVLHAEPDARFH